MELPLDIRMALCARARAKRQWPKIGFSDQSAGLLAQLLGINLKHHLSPIDERRLIQRNQWFDDCCRNFFQRHPHAMCIELGAGLSTRFHRLSAAADWPRFHWVEVDLPHITALKAEVLPVTDNYQLIGADILRDDWLSLCGWKPEQPLLVLLEAVAPELKRNSLMLLLGRLRQRVGNVELEIILDDYRPCFWQGWLKRFAIFFGVPFKIPFANYFCELERQGFHIARQKPLLDNTVMGMVINCQ